MKKPEGLRRLLLATALKDQPEKLQLFIDRGGVTCRRGRNLAFAYDYTLNVVVQGYTGEVNALMVPVLAWVAEQQPDLLDKAPYKPFEFESELLDDDSADVSINIELTENVLVDRIGKLSCPLLSGPSTMTVWTKEGTTNACEEAQARGDHREAA